MPIATDELIDFTQYLDFNSSGRAQCPVCLEEGKKTRNISISPEGKIKCHRDCSFPDILNALGIDTKAPANQAPIAKRISPATKKDIKPEGTPKFHLERVVDYNHHTLMTKSTIAKEWLGNRGINEEMILRYRLGFTKRDFKGETYPCITIPCNRKGGWQNKYFPAPWIPKDERLDGEGNRQGQFKILALKLIGISPSKATKRPNFGSLKVNGMRWYQLKNLLMPTSQTSTFVQALAAVALSHLTYRHYSHINKSIFGTTSTM